jgi:hypothetical protein
LPPFAFHRLLADDRQHDAACSPPITEMRAFGHIHRKRGL